MPSVAPHGAVRLLKLHLRPEPPNPPLNTHPLFSFVSHPQRDGWAVLDDSLGARWEAYGTAWPWTTGRAEPALPASADTCAAVGWDRCVSRGGCGGGGGGGATV